jgi:hypothetical protein
MKLDRNAFIIQASNDFLCEELPANYKDMTEQEVFEHIDENIWEVVEGQTAAEVLEMIENSADGWMTFVEKLIEKG